MSSKSLMMLRTAIRSPEKFQGRSTGDQDLDRLLSSWSDQQRQDLQRHESSNALPRAMNDVFLSDRYTPAVVRQNEVLGPFVRDVDDGHLDKVRGMMVAKTRCDEDIEPI